MKMNFKMLALLVLASTQVWAQGPGFNPQPVQPTATCMIPKIDGERVPFPLRAANSKYSLVENETYLVNGTVAMMNNKFYIKVDFQTQPWLATEKVMQFPYFYIGTDSSMNLDKFVASGELVQMAVVARHENGEGLTVEGRPTLNVELILPPTPITIVAEPKLLGP